MTPGLYDRPVRVAGFLLVVTACAPAEEDIAFGMVGEVADQLERGSTVGLWIVSSPVEYVYKFGSGSASPTIFGIEFRTDPPPEAIDVGGVGVALIGNLPGLATLPDGIVEVDRIVLIGLSTETAVIFKVPGGAGTAWSAAFPDGYSCGQCVRGIDELDRWVPIDCTFVTIERRLDDRCVWY